MEDHRQSKRIGGWMIGAAWVLIIGFLVYLFDDVLTAQFNPNQSIDTVIHADGRELTLTRNRYGHYVASGEINQHPVTFLLDTGATDIALSTKLANRLDLEPGIRIKVSTANGIIFGERTRLDTVSLGDIVLSDLPATVIDSGPDGQVLLGMAFLKRVEFTQRGDQLTIRQLHTD